MNKVDNQNDLDKFYNLISAIVNRPAMYGVQNIEGLSLIILGMSISSAGISEFAVDFNSKFRFFINNKYKDDFKSKTLDFDWPRLVRLYSASDRHSLELFGSLFNEFFESYTKEL
jgi:hypothetical protein